MVKRETFIEGRGSSTQGIECTDRKRKRRHRNNPFEKGKRRSKEQTIGTSAAMEVEGGRERAFTPCVDFNELARERETEEELKKIRNDAKVFSSCL